MTGRLFKESVAAAVCAALVLLSPGIPAWAAVARLVETPRGPAQIGLPPSVVALPPGLAPSPLGPAGSVPLASPLATPARAASAPAAAATAAAAPASSVPALPPPVVREPRPAAAAATTAARASSAATLASPAEEPRSAERGWSDAAARFDGAALESEAASAPVAPASAPSHSLAQRMLDARQPAANARARAPEVPARGSLAAGSYRKRNEIPWAVLAMGGLIGVSLGGGMTAGPFGLPVIFAAMSVMMAGALGTVLTWAGNDHKPLDRADVRDLRALGADAVRGLTARGSAVRLEAIGRLSEDPDAPNAVQLLRRLALAETTPENVDAALDGLGKRLEISDARRELERLRLELPAEYGSRVDAALGALREQASPVSVALDRTRRDELARRPRDVAESAEALARSLDDGPLPSRLRARALKELAAQLRAAGGDADRAATVSAQLAELMAAVPSEARASGSRALPSVDWRLALERRVGPVAAALAPRLALALAVPAVLYAAAALLPFNLLTFCALACVVFPAFLAWLFSDGKRFQDAFLFSMAQLGSLAFVRAPAPLAIFGVLIFAAYAALAGPAGSVPMKYLLAAAGVPSRAARRAAAAAAAGLDARQRGWARALAGTERARQAAIRELASAAPDDADALVPAIFALAENDQKALSPELLDLLAASGSPKARQALERLSLELDGPPKAWAAEALAAWRAPFAEASEPVAARHAEADTLAEAKAALAREPGTFLERLRHQALAEAVGRVEAASGDDRRLALASVRALLSGPSGAAAGSGALPGLAALAVADWRARLERRFGSGPVAAAATYVRLGAGLAAILAVALLVPVPSAALTPLALASLALLAYNAKRAGKAYAAGAWGLAATVVLAAAHGPGGAGAAVASYVLLNVLALLIAARGTLWRLAAWGAPAGLTRALMSRAAPGRPTRLQREWTRALTGSHHARVQAAVEMRAAPGEARALDGVVAALADSEPRLLSRTLVDVLAAMGTPRAEEALSGLAARTDTAAQPAASWAAAALRERAEEAKAAEAEAAAVPLETLASVDVGAEEARIAAAAQAARARADATLSGRLYAAELDRALARLQEASGDERRVTLDRLEDLVAAAPGGATGSRALGFDPAQAGGVWRVLGLGLLPLQSLWTLSPILGAGALLLHVAAGALALLCMAAPLRALSRPLVFGHVGEGLAFTAGPRELSADLPEWQPAQLALRRLTGRLGVAPDQAPTLGVLAYESGLDLPSWQGYSGGLALEARSLLGVGDGWLSESEAALEGVIGHELGHLATGEQRLFNRLAQSRRAWLWACVALVAAAPLVGWIVPAGALALWAAWKLLELAAQRRAELRADRFALRVAGFEAAQAFLQRLAQLDRRRGPETLLSDHPSAARRLKALQRAARQEPPQW